MSSDPHPVLLILGQAGAVSGGDVHAFRLAEYWSGEGTSVRLLGSPDIPQFMPSDSGSIIVSLRTPFDSSMRNNSWALAAGVVWRAVKAIKHCRNASVVVATSHLIFDTAPAVAAYFIMRKPVATYVYHIIAEMDRPRGIRTIIATSLERISLSLLKTVHANVFVDNEQVHETLLRRGFKSGNLHRTGNAYDPRNAVPDPTPEIPRRLLFLGRLVEQKGIWDIIELARRLRTAQSDVRIDIVGDGPLREQLAYTIDKEQLTNILLHGFVDEATKWRLLSTASLFLAPSREEGWGIAVGEAMLAGIPVIGLPLPAYSHFPTPFPRVASDGSDFADRAFEIATQSQLLRVLAEQAQRGRTDLPTWRQVITQDLTLLHRIHNEQLSQVRHRRR